MFFQPQMNQIIYCVLGFQTPIDIDSIKSTVQSSLMMTHPRFSFLMLRDSHGQERWRKTTQVDLDRHVIVLHDPVSSASGVHHETAVNDYLADLSTGSSLPTDKPMWEFHLLLAHNVMILRVHHALGDGISLMSMSLTGCRRADDADKLPSLATEKSSTSKFIGVEKKKRFVGSGEGVCGNGVVEFGICRGVCFEVFMGL